MEVPKEIQLEISSNQLQLKKAIRNHQILIWKLKDDPNNEEFKQEIQVIHREIVEIGHYQKNIVERLRKAVLESNSKPNQTKPGLEERRFNLASVLNKQKKQVICPRSDSLSPNSPQSDESQPEIFTPQPATPESIQELDSQQCSSTPTQSSFLSIFGLCTHDVFKELQNKRVERKRRSTANPHFLYGNHWENMTKSAKRRKNMYLQSNFSPPNTRSSLRKQKQEKRIPSPVVCKSESRSASPVSVKKQSIATAIGLNIPNLPSGLTIERVENTTVTTIELKCCVCYSGGSLSICEKCDANFHISCHNRPFSCPPKQCPKCLRESKRERDLTSLREPVSMTVVVGNGVQVSKEFKEKLEERKRLQEHNINLTHEVQILKERHAELTISLQTQEEEKQQLMVCEKSTKENIQRILDFVRKIKGTTATFEMATTVS